MYDSRWFLSDDAFLHNFSGIASPNHKVFFKLMNQRTGTFSCLSIFCGTKVVTTYGFLKSRSTEKTHRTKNMTISTSSPNPNTHFLTRKKVASCLNYYKNGIYTGRAREEARRRKACFEFNRHMDCVHKGNHRLEKNLCFFVVCSPHHTKKNWTTANCFLRVSPLKSICIAISHMDIITDWYLLLSLFLRAFLFSFYSIFKKTIFAPSGDLLWCDGWRWSWFLSILDNICILICFLKIPSSGLTCLR